MFKKRFTQWIPLGSYSNNDYIVFVRKNLKTGMMQFKTKMVHKWRFQKTPFFKDLINTQIAWQQIVNSVK